MDSFLGGITNFGSNVPSYGDVGSGYGGGFFDDGLTIEDFGRSLLGGLGSPRGIGDDLGRPRSYSDQTRSTMNSMLAQAIEAFGTPTSVI